MISNKKWTWISKTAQLHRIRSKCIAAAHKRPIIVWETITLQSRTFWKVWSIMSGTSRFDTACPVADWSTDVWPLGTQRVWCGHLMNSLRGDFWAFLNLPGIIKTRFDHFSTRAIDRIAILRRQVRITTKLYNEITKNQHDCDYEAKIDSKQLVRGI